MEKIIRLAKDIKEQGGRALLVGGYVRDQIIGIKSKDIDLECYKIQPNKLKEILNKYGEVNCVGESFQVYKLSWTDLEGIQEIDVSIPRVDKKINEGHKGFLVEGNPDSTFEDACRRRDFTINSIMFDPLTKEFIDPFNGRGDINNKIIRVVDHNHFIEDSLRILRAMQFASRFNFDIDEDTINLCRSIIINDLPKERIWEEFEKMILKSPKPWKGIIVADQLGIVNQLFPQLKNLLYHIKSNNILFNPMDSVIPQCENLSDEDKIKVLMGCLCAYINEYEVESFLDEIGIICAGNKVREEVLALARDFDTPFKFRYAEVEAPGGYRVAEEGDFRRLSQRVNPRLLNICIGVVEEDAPEWFMNKMEEYGVADGPPEPLLKGRHLIEMGIESGPKMGDLIKSIYELQLDGFVNTLEQAKQVVEICLKKERENKEITTLATEALNESFS